MIVVLELSQVATRKKMEIKFKAADYGVLILILTFSIFVGLFHEFKQKINNLKYFNKKKIFNDENKELNNEENTNSKTNEYLTGNSSISSVPIAFSLLASFYSATSLLGIPAEVYQYGIQYWIGVFGMMLTPVSKIF